MEFVSGKVDYKAKDEEGNILSKYSFPYNNNSFNFREAAEHLAKYRARCNSC
jgi:hypothetical protein